ncbi:BOLA class I histocompatibility antigen, alpha chain BL3-7-like isoform X3 [Leuresthes tenuis]|uniref:BOLA class I histocompatibility antigen, alpha chain BL3-7-like isoform X3 n=1 Tax=Leuresthes tenuis TaxID=355514 RepID=UPI003B501153
MKPFMFLLLLGIHDVATVTHSLKYFYTANSGVSNFPEFVAVGLVDEVQMLHYDSLTARATAKQHWVKKVEAEHPQYLQKNTESFGIAQNVYKQNIDIAKQRFNQSEGIHILQMMSVCEFDDETGISQGYEQFGYDGEDFIMFDTKTETWITPTPQAHLTRLKWDRDRNERAYRKSYFTQTCIEWLKKYLDYGKSSLMRTERPSVSLLQKTPSSAVSCHATGFYPNRAELLWRRDGEEVHEGVDKGEVLPNNDGSFQMSADLDLSSVPTEDWMKYECVFQLSGAEDLTTKLEKTKIRSNTGSNLIMIALIIVAAVVLVVIAVIGFILHKKKNAKLPLSESKKYLFSSAYFPSVMNLTESVLSVSV